MPDRVHGREAMSDLDLDPESARYLLGEMTETERDAFEERFLDDDDAQILVGATEGELFTAYAENALDGPRQRRFEATFLRDEKGERRLAATRARLRVAQAHPVAPPSPAPAPPPRRTWLKSLLAFFSRGPAARM
jgi:hypothetical protein